MKPSYSIYTLDLSSAGSQKIHGLWGIVRVLYAEDNSGNASPTVKINVRAGEGADAVPLSFGQAFMVQGADKPKEWILEWAAQSGVTATVGFASDASLIDWDADPAAQVLGGSITLSRSTDLTTTADEEITGASTEQVLAANASRREALITNLAGNASNIRVGDANTGAARGIEVAPGQTITLDTQDAISVYSPTTQSVALLEILD